MSFYYDLYDEFNVNDSLGNKLVECVNEKRDKISQVYYNVTVFAFIMIIILNTGAAPICFRTCV